MEPDREGGSGLNHFPFQGTLERQKPHANGWEGILSLGFLAFSSSMF